MFNTVFMHVSQRGVSGGLFTASAPNFCEASIHAGFTARKMAQPCGFQAPEMQSQCWCDFVNPVTMQDPRVILRTRMSSGFVALVSMRVSRTDAANPELERLLQSSIHAGFRPSLYKPSIYAGSRHSTLWKPLVY